MHSPASMTEPAAPAELTALFFSAVHAGSLPEAQTVLAGGVSINAHDASDQTALIVAIQAGHSIRKKRGNTQIMSLPKPHSE